MAAKPVYKTLIANIDDGLDGVFSDMSEDSYNDIVGDETHPTLGWDYKNYAEKNPVVLGNHKGDALPIARVSNLRVERGALRGKIHLAPIGSSVATDEARALISCGILRGISVGFVPTLSVPRKGGSGTHFKRMTLMEISIVALPANSNAYLQAKSMGVRATTIRELFKENQNTSLATRITVARYSVAQRQAIHAKAKAYVAEINRKRAPPPKLTAQQRADAAAFAKKAQDEADRKAYRDAVHRKAKARVAAMNREADLQKRMWELSIKDPPPFEAEPEYVVWQGQPIYVKGWR
jgi:HK97 family phage prohead protease